MQSKGGKARAEKLTPERRAAIASKAAKQRWAARKPGMVTKSVTMPAEHWAFVLERCKALKLQPSDWIMRLINDTRKRLAEPKIKAVAQPAKVEADTRPIRGFDRDTGEPIR